MLIDVDCSSSTTRYDSVLQSTTLYYKVRLCTTKYDSVLQSTTLYYKVRLGITRYDSVLQSTTLYYIARLSATEYDSGTTRYDSVLQGADPDLRSTVIEALEPEKTKEMFTQILPKTI